MPSLLLSFAAPAAMIALIAGMLSMMPALRPPATGAARQLLVQHQAVIAAALKASTLAGVVTPTRQPWEPASPYTSCVDAGVVVTSTPLDIIPPPAAIAKALAKEVYGAAGYGIAQAGTVRYNMTLPVLSIPTQCQVPDGAAVAVTAVR